MNEKEMMREGNDATTLSTTCRGSRDVNKHTEDPVFSLTYRWRKLRAVIPKMFLFFWNAYISSIAYVSTPCRVETLKIDIKIRIEIRPPSSEE